VVTFIDEWIIWDDAPEKLNGMDREGIGRVIPEGSKLQTQPSVSRSLIPGNDGDFVFPDKLG
jgi:hypothetical protein